MKSLLKSAINLVLMLAVLVSGSSLLLGFNQPAIALSNSSTLSSSSASYQIASAPEIARERALDEFEDKTSPEARRELEKAVSNPQAKVRRDLNNAQRKVERTADAAQDKAERGINRAKRAAENAADEAESRTDRWFD